jgi:hypothetical protein
LRSHAVSGVAGPVRSGAARPGARLAALRLRSSPDFRLASHARSKPAARPCWIVHEGAARRRCACRRGVGIRGVGRAWAVIGGAESGGRGLEDGLFGEAAGDGYEEEGGERHQGGEEEVVAGAGQQSAVTGQGVDRGGEHVARGDAQQECGHDQRLQRARSLRVGELQAGDRHEDLGGRQHHIREQLPGDRRRCAGADTGFDPGRHQEGRGGQEQAGRHLAQRGHTHSTFDQRVDAVGEGRDEQQDQYRVDGLDL